MAAKDQTASKASRSWNQYLVKAVFDASAPDWPKRSEAEIRTYEQELNRGYECQLFALPSPIAVSGDLKRIINVSVGAMNFRIYPPFALNEKEACVWIVRRSRHSRGRRACRKHNYHSKRC